MKCNNCDKDFNKKECNTLIGHGKCSICELVWYCSKHCQRADWKARHKQACANLSDYAKDIISLSSSICRGDKKNRAALKRIYANHIFDGK